MVWRYRYLCLPIRGKVAGLFRMKVAYTESLRSVYPSRL